jgi:type III restriction enzyme
MLVLEVKGEDSPQNQTKREFLAEWVRAVNEQRGFGVWASDVSRDPNDIAGIIERHARS